MNFADTKAEACFRAKVRRWLNENAPTPLESGLRALDSNINIDAAFLAEAKAWQLQKYEAGWACLHWPSAWRGGPDISPIERVIWAQEEGPFALLSVPFFMGHNICSAPLLSYGTPAQKEENLPPMAAGRFIWCQLFSEPGAGSDLAGVRTRAEFVGDDGWLINGQKIWTSFGHFADRAILLARTDPDLPKHKGLSMFIIDMKSPGIEVRPIRQANGQSEFNEVFLSNVLVADDARIGLRGQGWEAALTTLMNERLAVGASAPTGFDEVFSFCRIATLNGRPALDDSAVQHRLARWAATANGLKYTGWRTITALSRGETPGPEESIGKLVRASMLQEIAAFALDLQGPVGVTLDDRGAEFSGCFQRMLLRSPGHRIEGGTDEIMRNIIAERVLGLPQEMRADKGLAFNEIPTSRR